LNLPAEVLWFVRDNGFFQPYMLLIILLELLFAIRSCHHCF